MKPTELNVCGAVYKVIYFDNPANVDNEKRQALWGLHDPWTREIRVYDHEHSTCPQNLWRVIIHEVLHAIGEHCHLDILDKGGMKDDSKHEQLDVLATMLTDFLFRNNLVNETGTATIALSDRSLPSLRETK